MNVIEAFSLLTNEWGDKSSTRQDEEITTEVCTKSPGRQDFYAKISDSAPPEELPEQCA